MAPRSEVPPIPHKRLGDVLLEEEAITRDQLEKALEVQRRDGGFLGQILVKMGLTTQEAVASCLVKQCKIPHLSLLDYDITKEVLGLVPQEVCEKYNLLPIDKLGRILTVAMVDPLDLDALEEVRRYCPELRIKPILCNWEHYVHVKRKLFDQGQNPGSPTEITASSLGLVDRMSPVEQKQWKASESGSTIDDESLRHAVDTLIQQAAAAESKGETPISERRTTTAGGTPVAAVDSPGLTQEQLAAVFRDTLRDTVTALSGQLHAHNEPQISNADFAAMIRESVAGAVRDAVSALAPQMGKSVEVTRPAPAGPALDSLSETIRDSIAGVMQESFATLLVQMRAIAGRKENETEALAMEMAKALREGVRDIQEQQESRLAQIAEAAMQSAQQVSHLVESAAVSTGNLRELSGGRRRRHLSVTPFGRGGESNTPEVAESDAQVLDAMESEQPVESYTFDSYFPGKANAFTHQLSLAVAKKPGAEYNPFFLYGDVGVGKTHLISAIGNAVLQNNPKTRVGYISASHFSRRLMDAAREGALDAFRENYCHWDVLILDDIQFLGGRVEAQEEFFHIFNVLRQEGRQIIIASDKAPDRLGLLEKRLISRFASGIVASLKAPEWETRMQILRHWVEDAKIAVPDEILSLIAMRVPNDIRKMTGSLRKVVAFAKLVGSSISCELAGEILNHLGVEEAA